MPGINPAMLENQIKLAEAKVTVWEQKRACYNAKQTKERAFIQTMVESLIGVPDGPLQIPARQACAHYLAAHKAHDEAELQIIDLTIAELKSQAAINKAMLEDALDGGKKIVPAGGQRM